MSAAFLRNHPGAKWAGIALVAIALLALPFALAVAGTAWVRITNLAILFALLSLGLNIVVGYAGLLDLGYIAFYAVGAVRLRAARLAPLRACTCRGGRSCRSGRRWRASSASCSARRRSSCAATTSRS
jgi:hypothetical protein